MYVIIVGAGNIGTPLIRMATQESHEVVVIEKNGDVAAEAAQEYDCLVLNDDATVMDTLEDAGAEDADAIISTTDQDATNVMVMLLAKEIGIPSQVSVVHDPEHMDLFRRIEVNVLENPQELIAEYLYRAVQRPTIRDFMHLGGSAEIFEVLVTEGAPIVDVTLQEADEQGLLGEDVLVVAIERDREVITPKGRTAIQQGDVVTVFSKSGFEPDVLALFGEDEGEWML